MICIDAFFGMFLEVEAADMNHPSARMPDAQAAFICNEKHTEECAP
jgi:hypothetical protein